MAIDEQVLRKIARKFTGREKFRLSDTEREIVQILEESGHLSIRFPATEFIGEVARPVGRGY